MGANWCDIITFFGGNHYLFLLKNGESVIIDLIIVLYT